MSYQKQFRNIGKDEIHKVLPYIPDSGIIFLKGTLGMGKTYISQEIIRFFLKKKTHVTSPTYAYYHMYDSIYHFDLYRLSGYNDFIQIGGEEILENHTGLILIEWPDVLEGIMYPDCIIHITKSQFLDKRNIDIEYITPLQCFLKSPESENIL